jgi:hypothetical protein
MLNMSERDIMKGKNYLFKAHVTELLKKRDKIIFQAPDRIEK